MGYNGTEWTPQFKVGDYIEYNGNKMYIKNVNLDNQTYDFDKGALSGEYIDYGYNPPPPNEYIESLSNSGIPYGEPTRETLYNVTPDDVIELREQEKQMAMKTIPPAVLISSAGGRKRSRRDRKSKKSRRTKKNRRSCKKSKKY